MEFCHNCGHKIKPSDVFCTNCGVVLSGSSSDLERPQNNIRNGFSTKINDPRFLNYINRTKKYRKQFGFGLAVLAILGFYLYGNFSDEIDNPEALYIGLGIGSMFFLIGLFWNRSYGTESSWDGIVTNKKIEEVKSKKSGKTNFYTVISIKKNNGETVDYLSDMSYKKDTAIFDYYNVGDHVRYHGPLRTYEKFDKSYDEYIFCNACNYLMDINEDICSNCGCPLLK